MEVRHYKLASKLAQERDLKKLVLSWNQLDLQFIRKNKAHFIGLTELDLSYNKINDEAVNEMPMMRSL